ncbi:MAG: DUF202 domain-containing protein [Desulfomonilaceae bacterium]
MARWLELDYYAERSGKKLSCKETLGSEENLMGKKSEEQQILRVLIQLAQEENKLTENMVDMMAKTNELAQRRTESADLRTRLSEERTDLARQQTNLVSKSADLAEKRTQSADKRTELSQERTELAREQTKFSARSTELAEKRTELSEVRTDLAKDRTLLAEERTGLSQTRTELAAERNNLASNRTLLSSYRSVLAKGRTELAFIRTGLAFVALGIGLMRYFGVGLWTILDCSLVAVGIGSTVFGVKNYLVTWKYERVFQERVLALISDVNSQNPRQSDLV